MLLGRPPFETTNLKETYRCIREAKYSLPSSLLPPAKHLIASMLSKNPEDRPSLDDIVRHDFFLVSSNIFAFGVSSFSNDTGCWQLIICIYICMFSFYRVSLQTGFQLAVVTQFLTSTCQVRLRISSKRLLQLSLGARRKKQDTLTHTVCIHLYLGALCWKCFFKNLVICSTIFACSASLCP